MSKRKLKNIRFASAALLMATAVAVSPVLGACSSGKSSGNTAGTTTNTERTLSRSAGTFINHIKRIKTPITLDSEAEIDAGYIIYEVLTDYDKEDDTVKENKTLLDGYKAEYDILRAAKDLEEENARQAALRNNFKNAVAKLPATDNLTTAHRKDIENAFALYELLGAESKEDESVKTAYATLNALKSRLEELEEEEYWEEVAATAKDFIDRVEGLDEITLESIDDLEDLLYDYSKFSDDIKSYEGVAEAKQRLDEAVEEYQELKDEDDIEKFLAYAEELSPVESVTLDSERTIIKAEDLYGEMSEKAKSADGVSEAYDILVAARARFDELFAVAEAERVQIFIAAANRVGTNLNEVDISWYEVLEAAADAYWSLTTESQRLPEVEEAFKRWDAAQTVFDKKGYRKLPAPNTGLALSTDAAPNIVLQGYTSAKIPLLDFYGVSTLAELDSVASICLFVYVGDTYQGKICVAFSSIVNGFIIQGNAVKEALRQLAQTNGNIVSGAIYSFEVGFEDKSNEYIPSVRSKKSNGGVYNW